MAAFLNWYGGLGVAALFASLMLGYAVDLGAAGVDWHAALGLFAVLLAILWLAVLMFHFIYTGGAVKRAAAAGFATAEDWRATRGYKMSLFPWILVAIVLLAAAPYLGAASGAGDAPRVYHHVVVWEAWMVSAFVWWRSRPILRQNADILHRAMTAIREAIARRKAAKG